MLSRTLLALALAGAVATPALAAENTSPDVTIYRADNNSLFSPTTSGTVDAGHAVVRESRRLNLSSGTQDVILNDLPEFVDPEAVSLDLSGKASVLSQRLLLPRGPNGTLNGHVGKEVTVLGDGGQTLAKGTLTRVNKDGSLVLGGDVFGPTLISHYAAVKLTGGQVGGGARLDLRVKAASAGDSAVRLTYPTAGLGWRAAYTGELETGHSCRLTVHSMASIANRSGRDWNNANIKLVAGAPNFTSGNSPRPMMMRSMAVSADSAPMPKQGSLSTYRTYTLPGSVTLPDASVTLAPLYADKTVSCEDTLLVDVQRGNTYQPTRPNTSNPGNGIATIGVSHAIRFRAFDSFPAGTMRVLTKGSDGHSEFIGEGNVRDTPKGQDVNLTLGAAFDLTAKHQVTHFEVNKAAHTMTVDVKVALSNAGASARTVTVEAHPAWRWNNWKLESSSISPSVQNPGELTFKVSVPAGGNQDLTYRLTYSWTAADE